MGPLVADRVKETSATTGTGTLDLAGAASGFRTFVAGIGTGNTVFYAIVHQSAAEWEVGIGTVTDAATDTLSRTTIIASSNAGAAVNFSAGTKDVFATYPGARFGPLFTFTPPVDADFAWINQGTATCVQTNGGLLTGDALVLSDVANASATSKCIRKKAAPSTPYTITAALMMIGDLAKHCIGGLCFRQSSDGKLHCLELFLGNSSTNIFIGSRKFTNETTLSADYELNAGNGRAEATVQWLRIADDGTNRKCSISRDGQNWVEFHSIGRTDFLTADEVGFYVDPNAGDTAVTLLSWKQG